MKNTIRYHVVTLGIVLLVPVMCAGADFHGKIVKSKGDVVIRDMNGQERSPDVSDYIAVKDEEINTRSGGKAVVKFTNGSMTVIGENSSLGIEKPTLFAHLKGKILFAFAKNTGPTRMVRTPSAVFGVRATTFVVDKNDEGETMALKEGLVNVESPEGAFEIHQKKEQRDLDAFKAEMEQGVKDMKKEGDAFIKQEKDDYVAFKK
ncbi:MAG: FecR family protein, partial [Proteobacteria bacterium]|nr:FecR family protein [Pseudomonadota bacterium]